MVRVECGTDSEDEEPAEPLSDAEASDSKDAKASPTRAPLEQADADDLWRFVRSKVSGFVGVQLRFFALNGVQHPCPCCLVAQVAPQRQNTWVLLANRRSPLLARLLVMIRSSEADAEDLLRMMLDTAMWPSEFCPARIAQPRGSAPLEQPMYQHNGWSLEVPGPHRLMLPYRRRLPVDADEDVDLFRPAFLHLCMRRDAAISAELSMPREELLADDDLGDRLLLWSPAFTAVALGRPVLECVFGDGQEGIDWVWLLSLFFGVPLVDRTKLLPGRVRCEILDPLPSKEDVSAFTASLSDILGERARELRDRAKLEGLNLELFWSGGIDSTSALVALVQTTGPQFTVKYHSSSIEEYPLLFERLQNMSEVQLVEIDGSDPVDLEHPSAVGGTHATNLRDHVGSQGSLSVTGELGDQLFGSHLLRRAFYGHEDQAAEEKDPWRHIRQLGLGAPWQDVLVPMLRERELIPPSCSQTDVEQALQQWLEASPIPVVSTFDFLWWTNFSLKWQHVALRMFNGRASIDSEVCLKHTAHFFQSSSFQAWSMKASNHSTKMPDLQTWTSYKWPLKEYIFQFTKDDLYLRTKEKEGSFRHDALSARNLALDNKFRVLGWGAHSLSRRQMRSKYGHRLLHFLSALSPFDGHPEYFDQDERKERVANPIGRQTLELKCRSLLPPELVRGRSVLDLGACLGAMGEWALFHGASSYTALEVQPDFVRRARQCLQHWGDRARCVQGDTRAFLGECTDGSFDIIICAGILHCFLEPLAICAEVQRVAAHAVVVESINPMGVLSGNVNDQIPMLQVYSEAPVNVQRTFASLTGVSTLPSLAALKVIFGLAGFEATPVHVPPSSDPMLSIYAAVLPGSVAPVRFFVRFVRRRADQVCKLQSLESSLLQFSKAAESLPSTACEESSAFQLTDWQVTGDRFGIWQGNEEEVQQSAGVETGFVRRHPRQVPGIGQARDMPSRLISDALIAHVAPQHRATAQLVIIGCAYQASELVALLNAGFRRVSVVDTSSIVIRQYQAAAVQHAEGREVTVRESEHLPTCDSPLKALVTTLDLQVMPSGKDCKDHLIELFNRLGSDGLLLLSAETSKSGQPGLSSAWFLNALEEVGFHEIEILHGFLGHLTVQALRPIETGCPETSSASRQRGQEKNSSEAAARALELGFLPNEELWKLPINAAAEEASDSRSCEEIMDADAETAAGRTSRASLAAQAAEAASLPTPSDAEVADLGIFPEHQCLPRLPYGWQKHLTMPISEAAKLELALGPETSVPKAELGSSILSYIPNFVYMIRNRSRSPFFSGNDVDRTMALGRLLSFPVIDRSGALSNGLRCKILHPIPKYDPDFKLSLEEILMQRARVLLNRYKAQRLHLLWSGGIDSTSMVIAFHRTATPEEWSSRIVLCYAERSKSENPKFYSSVVMAAPQQIVIEGHLRDFINGSRVVVLGDPADMLFGTVFMAGAVRDDPNNRYPNRMGDAGLDSPWRSVVPDMLRDRELLAPGPEAEAVWCRWISRFLDRSPVKIQTVFDFFWWCSFALKWQHDLLRIFYNRTHVDEQLVESVNYFYATDDFQQWSFHHHNEKMQDKRVWASYKWPLKEFILRHTGDHEYYAGKVKVPSCAHSWGYQLALDDRWNVIQFGRFCISRARMRERYGEHLFDYLELHPTELNSTDADKDVETDADEVVGHSPVMDSEAARLEMADL